MSSRVGPRPQMPEDEIREWREDSTQQGWWLDQTVDDLPLTHQQRLAVLEWFARKLWTIREEASGEPDYYGKSYDPLLIECCTAHSYVFDLEDGGRHHSFHGLPHLEKMLVDDVIRWLRPPPPSE